MKSLFKSKRFRLGVAALLTGIAVMLTGEKTWQQILPEMILTIIGLGQTIVAIMSNTELALGGKSIAKFK